MRTPSFSFASFASFAPALLIVAAGASLAAAGCSGPPKVLVDHSYASSDKSVETYIQKAGASVGTGKDKTELFNVFMRVCNQDASNAMAVCKDTLILENVNPRSL